MLKRMNKEIKRKKKGREKKIFGKKRRGKRQ